MSNINEKLQEAIDIKNNIKQALVDKKVDMTDVSFGGYPDKIRSIKGSDSSVYISYEYPEIMDVVPTDASNAFSKKIDDSKKIKIDDFQMISFEHYAGNTMYGGHRLILGAYNDESKSNDHANHYTLYLYKRLMDSIGNKCGYTQCEGSVGNFFQCDENSDNAIQQLDYSGFKFKNAGVGDMYGSLSFYSVFPYPPINEYRYSSLKISNNDSYGNNIWTDDDVNDVNNHYKFATIPAQYVSSFLDDNMVFSSFDDNGNRKDSLSSDSSRYMDLFTKNHMPKSYHVWSDLSKYGIQDSNSQFVDTFFNDEVHVYLGGTKEDGENNKYFQLQANNDGTLISRPNPDFIESTDASFNDMFNSMPDDVSFDITRSFTINTSDNNTWENKEINWKNIVFKKPEIPSKFHVYSFDFGAFQDSSAFKNLIGVSGSSDEIDYSADIDHQKGIEIIDNNHNGKYLFFDKRFYDQHGNREDSLYISDDQWTKITDSSALTPAEFRNGEIYIYKDDLTINENTIFKLADDKGNSYYGYTSINNKNNETSNQPKSSVVLIGYNCPEFNISTVICKHGWSMNVYNYGWKSCQISLYLDGKSIDSLSSIGNSSLEAIMHGSTEYYKIEAVEPNDTNTRNNAVSLPLNDNTINAIVYGEDVSFKLKVSKRSYDASGNESYTQVWISDTINVKEE